MFSKRHKKEQGRAAAHAERVSIIAAGMQVAGDIEAEGDIRIDGTVNGNVFCRGKVVVITSGHVNGDIHAVNADVHGTVSGNMIVKELLSLKAHCSIKGNLSTGRLQIEPNALFNGHCTMTFEDQESLSEEVRANGLLFQDQ